MKSLFERLRLGRLATTFTILATLSAGILIGSVAAHGVKGQENKVDSSDANPLRIPSAKALSNTFSQIAKEVGPAVVNINTEQLPKASSSKRKNPARPHPQPIPDPDDQQPGETTMTIRTADRVARTRLRVSGFFNRFFGGPLRPGRR